MEFKEFLNIGTVDESAQLKLELITQINTLIGTAEISTLRRVAKMLEVPAPVPAPVTEANLPYAEEWKEFERVLASLAKVCTTEEQAKSLEKVLWSRLDKPLSNAIDLVVGGGKFNKSTFITALQAGEDKEGTEPRAALSGAITFMFQAIQKLK